MSEQLQREERTAPAHVAPGRKARGGRVPRSLATVLRRSAQCLRIAPRERSDGGAPTHRIIFTFPDGDDIPEAARKMTRAFGLGFALVLSLRSARHLCRVFAVSGTHVGGLTSLHFTVSLREFAAESVNWRARPLARSRGRLATRGIGVTLPLPL
jgi:hypothetical protein